MFEAPGTCEGRQLPVNHARNFLPNEAGARNFYWPVCVFMYCLNGPTFDPVVKFCRHRLVYFRLNQLPKTTTTWWQCAATLIHLVCFPVLCVTFVYDSMLIQQTQRMVSLPNFEWDPFDFDKHRLITKYLCLHLEHFFCTRDRRASSTVQWYCNWSETVTFKKMFIYCSLCLEIIYFWTCTL